MTHNIYNTPAPHNTDSDDSDGDEMLPMGAFWPAPEDEKWTMMERSHGSLRGAKGIDSDRLHNSGDKLDHSGMRCGQLDYIDEKDNRCTRSEALLSNRKEATRYDRSPPGDQLMTESPTASVRPAIGKRPNVIVVVPRKTADRLVIWPVNVVPTPQVELHNSLCVEKQAGELFPEEPEVIPAKMAKEASTEGPTDKQDLQNNRNYMLTTAGVDILEPEIRHPPDMMAEEASTGDTEDNQPLNVNQLFIMTTVTILPTDYAEIERPAPRRVLVEVAEEASTDDTKIEKCMYDVMDNNETTERKLSTELLEIPQQLVTRGFLELAEEARNIGVEKKQSFLVEKVLPQVTEMTRPMIELLD